MNIKPGQIWEHFKGKRYRIHHVVKHSETLEDLVVYECLHENDLSQFWVRPIENFFDTKQIDGKIVPRFKLISDPKETA